MADKSRANERAGVEKFAKEEIAYIVNTFGKRRAGSEGEQRSIEYMADKCYGFGCGDNVSVEKFTTHPNGYHGGLYLGAVMILVASLFTTICAVVIMPTRAIVGMASTSLVLIVMALLLIFCECMLCRKVVDWMYLKSKSSNLYAAKKPLGEIKHRVIIAAHADAGGEITLNYLGGGQLFSAHVIIIVIGLLYAVAINICALCGVQGEALAISAYVLVLFVPFWIGIFIMWDDSRMVDGANNNLSGCMVALSVLNGLKESGKSLKNTEVGILITGCEKAGLGGAKAWCAAHAQQMQEVDTIVVYMDTIHSVEQFRVDNYDMFKLIKNDDAAADIFVEAARESGVDCGRCNSFFGVRDCAAYRRAGFRAIAVSGSDPKQLRYYSTRKDTTSNINPTAIGNCYAATMRMIEKIDEQD